MHSILGPCYNGDGSPNKCRYCKSTDFEEIVKEKINYDVAEYEVKCKKCGKTIGYWAYGNWVL